MTQVVRVSSMGELRRAIHKSAKARRKRVVKAIQEAAKAMEPKIRERIPEAFGRLRKQLDTINTTDGAKIRDDAPYAAAVEVGSRPHLVPLDDLIDWVLAKGFARDMDEAENIARAVQQKIRTEGTDPVFYMRSSLPDLHSKLGELIREAMKEMDLEPSISTGGGGKSGSSSSGRYRQNQSTFRGHRIQVDHQGRQFVQFRGGKVHYITGK